MKYGLLTKILRRALVLLFVTGVSHVAFAGPVEIEYIQIVPTETTMGKYPEITGSIKANTLNKPGEIIEMIVIATVVRPDNVMKSWTWKNVTMKAGEIRSFSIPGEYEIKSAGSYSVDFNLYSKDMQPLQRLTKTFVAVDPSLPPAKTKPPEKRRPVDYSILNRHAADYRDEYRIVGLGVYSNTLNGTGGVTMLLWPFKYVGLQGSYTMGLFTIAEGRLLARYPLPSGLNAYLGAGFMNVTAERTVNAINVKTQFNGSGVSGVLGAEVPVGKNLFGYVEICGSPIVLKKEVTNGVVTGTADVKFSPVSIGLGFVYFLF